MPPAGRCRMGEHYAEILDVDVPTSRVGHGLLASGNSAHPNRLYILVRESIGSAALVCLLAAGRKRWAG